MMCLCYRNNGLISPGKCCLTCVIQQEQQSVTWHAIAGSMSAGEKT